MEQDLIDQLLASGPLAALVDGEITWSVRNRGAGLPALVLHKISETPSNGVGGADAFTGYRVQADALAETAADAVAVRQAFRAALSTLSRPFAAPGVVLSGFGDFDHIDAPDAGGATDLHRQSTDVRLWHLTTP